MNNSPAWSPLYGLGYGIPEFTKMFALEEEALDWKILNCQAGLNIFSAEMAKAGRRVVACDPLYQSPLSEIQNRALQARMTFAADWARYPERFSLESAYIPQKLASAQADLERLCEDLPGGLIEGRYIAEALPGLSFRNEQFDLALVNHFLFTQALSVAFQVQALEALARVANEIRIFPLVDSEDKVPNTLGEVIARLQQVGLSTEIRPVAFTVQKQDNAILRIWTDSCTVAAHKNIAENP